MKIKIYFLYAFLTVTPIILMARQPVFEDDGIVIMHRGFSDVISASNTAISQMNNTIQGVNAMVDETKKTIASIPKILTSAEFITNAGIKAVGITFCIGGAKWLWDGSNHIITSKAPILGKKEFKRKSRIVRSIADKKEKKQSHEAEDLLLTEFNKDQDALARAHFNRGVIKVVAGLFSLSVGCFAMFKTESVANLFGQK